MTIDPVTLWHGGGEGSKLAELCVVLAVERNECNKWRALEFWWEAVGKVGDRCAWPKV